jgi:outer membrane murein-binding lipoprotein Lpp
VLDRRTPAIVAGVALLAGCGSSSSDDVKAALVDGVAAIQGTQDYEQLRAELRRTLARLRGTHDGGAQRLALRGFEATLRGVQARIDFHENDSGNIKAATRDARRANAELSKGAKLLRAAGRLLGIRVGSLAGY